MSGIPKGLVERDPQLHNFYQKQLLEPGWAGCLERSEAQYIEKHLKANALLRWRWGFKGRGLPLRAIIARAFVENPMAAHRYFESSNGDRPLPRQADTEQEPVQAR